MQVETSAVERVDVDPKTLLVDTNIRLNANLNKDFVGSIRDLGVLQPIIAVRTAGGDIRVRYGHRRTLGAIEAERETVPVEIIGVEGEGDGEQVDRIIRQHAENAHRAALTSSEEVHVVEQLSAFGLSAGQIQKRTKMKRDAVSQALAVSRSELAKASVGRYSFLTLEQAAAVAEFQDDSESVKALVASAKAGGFEHLAQRLRDERTEREAVEVITKDLEAAGVRIVNRPRWDENAKRLSEIRVDGQRLDVSAHEKCEGHAAFIDEQWIGDEDKVEWVAVFVCTDPKVFGHIVTTSEAKLQRNETQSEEAKEIRRKVLANNKAWRSAETVRRAWLRNFLKRKTAPKGVQTFIMGELIRCPYELSKAMGRKNPFARELLDLNQNLNDGPKCDGLVAALDDASDGRATMLGLAVVLGAFESETGVHSWRSSFDATVRYLKALESWGYELSEVERMACGEVAA